MMKLEDIKVGETYNVRVKVIGKNKDCVDALYDDLDEITSGLRIPMKKVCILRPDNHKSAPKYDPCRLFKKGDKARIVSYKGRCYDCDTSRHEGDIVTINVNESELEQEDLISVRVDDDFFYTDPAYLELVTPVEELEPYVIWENDASYEVRLHSKKENHTMAIYNKNAYGDWLKTRYAAEAECDRLNAEYRKEQQ